MSSTGIRDQIATHLGGPYDPTVRGHPHPLLEGLGVVRRSRARRADTRAWHATPATAIHGTALFVVVGPGTESRVPFGAVRSELRMARHTVTLTVLLHSSARYSEDAADALLALRDRLVDRIRADLTFGSGGFEGGANIGFEVPTDAGTPEITTTTTSVTVAAGITTGELTVELAVDQYRTTS